MFLFVSLGFYIGGVPAGGCGGGVAGGGRTDWRNWCCRGEWQEVLARVEQYLTRIDFVLFGLFPPYASDFACTSG